MRPRLLDLFSGAGGAAMGYWRAGFDVVGVDIVDQPRYPFAFVRADALTYPLDGFDVVHASPPCQGYSSLRTTTSRPMPRLIGGTRDRLEAWGGSYVIENVPAARHALRSPVQACGTALGCADVETELRRHRLFEANVLLLGTSCRHDRGRRPLGVYGDLAVVDRPNRPVDGPTGAHGWKAGRARAHALMGIEWMTDPELAEAIPPAYTEHLGRQLLLALEVAA